MGKGYDEYMNSAPPARFWPGILLGLGLVVLGAAGLWLVDSGPDSPTVSRSTRPDRLSSEMGQEDSNLDQLRDTDRTELDYLAEDDEGMADSSDSADNQPTSASTATDSEMVGETAIVTAIVDGDTIKLASGVTVRYIGIDTPETTRGKDDCYGQEAVARNRALVLGKTVRLTKDVSETDRYGRLLRFVWLDARLVNEQLVAEGFAHAATFPPDVARAEEFVAAERAARSAGLGLWSACPGGATRSDYDTGIPQAATEDCPSDRPIKGNAQSEIYHLPGGRYYETTLPEECFATEADAQAAGYRRSKV